MTLAYVGYFRRLLMSIWWHLKILIIPVPKHINGQLRQKVNDVMHTKLTLPKAFKLMIILFISFCFREQTSVRKLFCTHYGKYW